MKFRKVIASAMTTGAIYTGSVAAQLDDPTIPATTLAAGSTMINTIVAWGLAAAVLAMVVAWAKGFMI